MNKKRIEYQSVEEAYNELVKSLTYYATKHVYSVDRALDAVQDAFVKTVEYKQKRPEAKLSKFILYREVARACRRINQEHKEISWSHEQILEHEEHSVEKKRGQIRPGFEK